MAKAVKRKSRNGRVLPDGVSERADGRYLYRYTLDKKTYYIYDRDISSLSDKIKQLTVDLNMGKNLNISKMTLNEYYPLFLDTFKKGKMKEASYLNMVHYFEWYIEPYDIGRIPMSKLRRTAFVKHFQMLADKKDLAHGTLRTLASMVAMALEQVVYDQGLVVNPAKEIMKDVTTKPAETRDALTKEQVDVLIDFLQQPGFQNIYLPMIGLMIGTGIRFGECDGLTWADVNFEEGYINIERTIHYRQRVEGGPHEYYCTSTKTESGERMIYLNDDLIGLLNKQKKYQKDMRIRDDFKANIYDNKGEVIGVAKNFVFTSKLGKPFTHEGFEATLRRIIKRCNEWQNKMAEETGERPVLIDEGITPHYFRHTFCTRTVEQMVEEGSTDYERIKVLMGHKSIKTSMDVYLTISQNLSKTTWKKAPTMFELSKSDTE